MAIPSKVLLFGEHIVIKGAKALAIPYHRFQAEWSFSAFSQDRQKGLLELLQHVRKHPLSRPFDLDSFAGDINRGIYLNSTIPQGFGLGSSGALVAAFYQRYCLDPIDAESRSGLIELKSLLGRIESAFHGASSGVDPLICCIRQPILIQADGSIQRTRIPDFEPDLPVRFFLVDTGIPRKTGPLVNTFLQEYDERPLFRKMVHQQLIPASNQAIDAFLKAKWKSLFKNFSSISRLQAEHFQSFIPPDFLGVWRALLDEPHIRIKLCGAGGGGFLFGMTDRPELLPSLNSRLTIIPLHW